MLRLQQRWTKAVDLLYQRRYYSRSCREKRIYVIAGEASGDAIGAKVIKALQRKLVTTKQPYQMIFRGVGGSQMCAMGDFKSLFPIEDLSVMGLFEILPFLWRLRRRQIETLNDISSFEPDLILTIDSKGFNFRIHRGLQAQARSMTKPPVRMHYVTPSVWAYRHRQPYDPTRIRALVHKMFAILPFEPELFQDTSWCTFVGHPSVEDFLEYHHAFDTITISSMEGKEVSFPTNGFLQNGDSKAVRLYKTALFRQWMLHSRQRQQSQVQEVLGINPKLGQPFIVCALLGSRVQEVRKTIPLVLKALNDFQQSIQHQVVVIVPTISSLQSLIQSEIDLFDQKCPTKHLLFRIRVDCNAMTRHELFSVANASVAVSGTIVMETTLALLPTVVIYRANKLTEWLAKWLSAVSFVSIPNLLLGRMVIPELLFGDCTPTAIADTLKGFYDQQIGLTEIDKRSDPSMDQVAMALSTLTPWSSDLTCPKPIRGSEIVADTLWNALVTKR